MLQYQSELLPIDHIVITYKDGTTRYVEHAVVGIAGAGSIDLSFCNMNKKEIIEFLVGMADIGEGIQYSRKDVEVRDCTS